MAAWSAIAGLVAFAAWGWAPSSFPPAFSLAMIVVWIGFEDLRRFTIPNTALVGFAALAMLDLIMRPMFTLEPVLSIGLFTLDGLLCGGSILLVREAYFRRKGEDGVGFGDVKLAAVGGLLCGVTAFAYALLAASLVGLAAALAARHFRLGEWNVRIPFGAFLAPALLVAWFLKAYT
ncbi:prepilin peptidase [Aureimonas sp. AU40]|uniref:prepilin peptidase n=1 Tax=Aureimonas sp. AU40 TaxID=1637747 RepID=UPI000782CF00|nr:prepilin peptidase [Aureimonas sp. AU40]